MQQTAQCACGATSITVDGTPSTYAICHCTNCKRRTGSAFGMSAYFNNTEVVKQEGSTVTYAFHNAEQGFDQVRHFCPTCGTTLFWNTSTSPKLIGIAAGCFNDQLTGQPKFSVTDSKRYHWVSIPDEWPKIPHSVSPRG
jgi:hypothetical protein